MNYFLQRLLIILGLVIIPFYEIFLKALPYVRNMAPDSRAPKEIIALVFALSIGLLAVFQGTIKPFRNKFFLIIPVYLLFNLFMAPHANLFINNIESGDFYFWKPFAQVLCFTIMIIGVSSIDIDFELIIKTMVICGFVMAIYVILQRFQLDQFWVPKGDTGDPINGNMFTAVRAQALGGNLGQPTIVSSWIVMMVPLAIYLRKWWMALIMALACILTHGIVAVGTLFVVMCFSLIKYHKLFLMPVILIFLFIGFMVVKHKDKVIDRMDGRYEVWKKIYKDIKNGQLQEGSNFSTTGIGFGRFAYLFPTKNRSHFQQAHNDPYEFLYDCGIIGEYLLLAGLFVMISSALIHSSLLCFFVLLSFISIFLCSLGSFPFQLGAHQFYSAVLVGLLHNEKIIRRG